MDFSGRVVLAGSSVESKFSPGTRVFGTANPVSAVLSGTGTLAEYISIPSNLVQVVPSKMHIRDVATLGGLAQTGQKMVDNAAVSAGHRVLIHGASGGVGIIALQLAKARGATVVATCSERNVRMVKAAGADEVSYARNIYYKTTIERADIRVDNRLQSKRPITYIRHEHLQ
jgi:NADPH:quinone reductase-like Zn-dependent oxidoreductase